MYAHLTLRSEFPDSFPLGTFLVNILGCFAIGLFYGLFERGNLMSPNLRIFLTVGFCGGFTTFSTFMNENFLLIKDDNFFYSSLCRPQLICRIHYVVLGTFIDKIILKCNMIKEMQPNLSCSSSHDGGTGKPVQAILQELLERRKQVSNLACPAKGKEEGISKSYKSFKIAHSGIRHSANVSSCSSQLTDVRFENLRPVQYILCRKFSLPGRIYFLQIIGNQSLETTMNHVFAA